MIGVIMAHHARLIAFSAMNTIDENGIEKNSLELFAFKLSLWLYFC
jgi:hypothetical protein